MFNKTCTIQVNNSSTNDANGQPIDKWETSQTGVRCRLSSPMTAGKIKIGDEHFVMMQTGLILERSAQLSAPPNKNRAIVDSDTFRIDSFVAQTGSFDIVTHYECVVTQTQP